MKKRFIIKDVSILEVPEFNFYGYELSHPIYAIPSVYSNDRMELGYQDRVDTITELVNLKKYNLINGEQFYIGIPYKVAEALGMQPSYVKGLETRISNLENKNENLTNQLFQQGILLDKEIWKYKKYHSTVNNLSFWKRLKFLFKGKIE